VNTGGSSSPSITYFGPYKLNVGCFNLGDATNPSFVVTNHASFVTSVALKVGGSTSGVYTMYNPSSNRAWCTQSANTIM
jgi:hypothetical protein